MLVLMILWYCDMESADDSCVDLDGSVNEGKNNDNNNNNLLQLTITLLSYE
jgi:hypothetical protein